MKKLLRNLSIVLMALVVMVGYLPARMHGDFDDIRVGDILRVNYGGHSVIVLDIQGSNYILAEGNYNNSIHWGRVMTLSQIKAEATYVMTRYPQ